jgi:hypothetical protein
VEHGRAASSCLPVTASTKPRSPHPRRCATGRRHSYELATTRYRRRKCQRSDSAHTRARGHMVGLRMSGSCRWRPTSWGHKEHGEYRPTFSSRRRRPFARTTRSSAMDGGSAKPTITGTNARGRDAKSVIRAGRRSRSCQIGWCQRLLRDGGCPIIAPDDPARRHVRMACVPAGGVPIG